MTNQTNSFKKTLYSLIPSITLACAITLNFAQEIVFAQSADCDFRQSQLQQSMPPRGERLVLTALEEWPQEIAGRAADTEGAIRRAQERIAEAIFLRVESITSNRMELKVNNNDEVLSFWKRIGISNPVWIWTWKTFNNLWKRLREIIL